MLDVLIAQLIVAGLRLRNIKKCTGKGIGQDRGHCIGYLAYRGFQGVGRLGAQRLGGFDGTVDNKVINIIIKKYSYLNNETV